jgi:predicted transcriptional regulator
MKPVIKSTQRLRDEMLAIARGEAKAAPDRPKVTFSSEAALMHVLSPENRKLLGYILRDRPESVSALVALSGKSQPNVSRALGVLERAGFIALEQNGANRRPVALVRHVHIDFDLASEEVGMALEAVA